MSPTEFPVLSFRNCSGGQFSAVDDSLIPDNGCRLSLGFRYDKIGMATQRNGYTRIGAAVSASNTADGLSGFVNASGSRNRLVAAYNGAEWAYNGSTWSMIGNMTVAGTRTRYAALVDLLFRAGGGDTALKSWDGDILNTFGSAQLSGAPNGSLLLAYKSRLYVAGNATFPDRLYYSSVPSLTGALTWDITTDYLDVNPADGDNITALSKVGTLMMVFKRNFIYRWNGTSTDAEPMINVGTISQETVANVEGTLYFFHPNGIFATDGGTPKEVSRPVKDFIEAIPAANYSSMCAYADGANFGLFCGTVTVAGRTYTNLVLEFDTNTETWQPHVFAHPFRVFANAKDSSGANYLAGAKETYVETMFSGTTDDGEPIVFERESKRIEFDGRYSTKYVDDGAFYLSNAPGAIFEAIATDMKGTQLAPQKLGTATNGITNFQGANVKGNAISFKISGTNRTAPAVWRGFDILKSRSLGNIRTIH